MVGSVVGIVTVVLSIYSTVMTRRQAAEQRRQQAAQARNEEAIVELQRNQSVALTRLAEFESERRTEEVEDRTRLARARASADLRADLIAAERNRTRLWLHLRNVGDAAAIDVRWAVTHDATVLDRDALNETLILKPGEHHRAMVASAEFPVPFDIMWRDGVGPHQRSFRLPQPPPLP